MICFDVYSPHPRPKAFKLTRDMTRDQSLRGDTVNGCWRDLSSINLTDLFVKLSLIYRAMHDENDLKVSFLHLFSFPFVSCFNFTRNV